MERKGQPPACVVQPGQQFHSAVAGRRRGAKWTQAGIEMEWR